MNSTRRQPRGRPAGHNTLPAESELGDQRSSSPGRTPHDMRAVGLEQPLRRGTRLATSIRVIGHEMNNSLAPIKSIAGSLAALLERDPPPPDWRDDMDRGLRVIASRSDGLSRFMSAYARLAKLPPPKLSPLDVASFVDRVVSLEKATHVRVASGPRLTIQGDRDQLEQLLINLLRNAMTRRVKQAAA